LFDQKFFKDVLSERHSAKSMESPEGDQASIVMTLHDDGEFWLAGLVEAGPGFAK
jgi:hypothetical protein